MVLGGHRGRVGPPNRASDPGFRALRAVVGRLAPGRHPIRATARVRINQFDEANNTLRWFRFLAIPR